MKQNAKFTILKKYINLSQIMEHKKEDAKTKRS